MFKVQSSDVSSLDFIANIPFLIKILNFEEILELASLNSIVDVFHGPKYTSELKIKSFS